MNISFNTLACTVAGIVLIVLMVVPAAAQEGSSIPKDFRGEDASIARGLLNGNLIESNFRNQGEVARVGDAPWSNWPRGIGNRHIDGIVPLAIGSVDGSRAAYPEFYGGLPDTILHPVIVNIKDFGRKIVDDTTWGWLPLPGFFNELRRDPITGLRNPTPAISDDPASWPEFWPDRLDNPDDPGWPGAWNGFFGKNVFNADQEGYFVVDDHSDYEYRIDPGTGRPNSPFGVFYPDDNDLTVGGMGLQMTMRILSWGNVLAEDAMFILHRVTNVGTTNLDTLYFSQMVDYGLGWEEGDENAAFDPVLDVAWGYDQDGIGTSATGGRYELGYTGIAYLESPVLRDDGLDNDEDGVIDEGRFSGPGMLIEGQDNIRAYVEANYDLTSFEIFNGPLEERPAYILGRWWTGDENLDWESFLDENENGILDPRELINDDVGIDGLGPNDLGYPGPDTGEADGIPSAREPDFDQTDIDEGDQIGLTGFSLLDRGLFTSSDNMRNDTWLYERLVEAEGNIVLGVTRPTSLEATDIEPWITFTSGFTSLAVQQTDFFSTAWVFGFNLDDFLRNRRVVQRIYNNDYRFAQPPIMPLVEVQPGDGYITLSWDTLALRSFDRFTQEFDFEGFKIYKGTDPLLSDARTITDGNGAPIFFEPLAQFDLENGIQGKVPVQDNNAIYDLGTDTGLQFSYIDRDVTNGKQYYYAVVAYDRGDPDGDLDPQENIFKIDVDLAGQVRGTSRNAVAVRPRSRSAGYTLPGVNEDLTSPAKGIGSGSVDVTIVSEANVDPNAVYRLSFFSDIPEARQRFYTTSGYQVENLTTQEVVVPRRSLSTNGETTVVQNAFTLSIDNQVERLDFSNTGWVDNLGSPGLRQEERFTNDPQEVGSLQTNWIVDSLFVTDENMGPAASRSPELTPFDYEIAWVNPEDSVYQILPFRPREFLFTRVPIFARNTSTGENARVFIQDVNRNREWDVEDIFYAGERINNEVELYYGVKFRTPPGEESIPPGPGAVVRLSSNQRPFATGDFFQFTLQGPSVDLDQAKQDLERIAVVPNPYVGAAEWEERTQVTGRGPRRVQFINLPQQCVIKIFTIRGELVRELVHEGTGSDGAIFWDLQTTDGQDVAYGVYLYHVEAEGIGEYVDKFAIIK